MFFSADNVPHSLYLHVQNLSYFPFFSELQPSHWSVTVFETLVLLTIFLVSLIGNIGALILVAHDRRLADHTLFTLNLFLADLLFVSTIPFVITVRWTKAWKLGSPAFQMIMDFIRLRGTVTITTLATIGVERLLAILKMEASPSLNLKRVFGVLLLIWFFSTITLLPLFLFSSVVPCHIALRLCLYGEIQVCILMCPHLMGEIAWNAILIVSASHICVDY
uniref:G-protein coupled receptors family 1 profile domain-containing protein n=1 Tax=Electrophorus electricus TaxID=8005 RepID=A0A4W4EQ20_ELEEL